MGGVPEHFNLPILLSKEFNLFQQKNIDLDWQYYPAGTGAMTKAIAENEIDVAIVLTEGAVSAIINGLDAKIIKQYISSPLIWGIHTGQASELKKIGDCNHKKYAISRFGSGSHLMAMIDAKVRKTEIKTEEFVLIENLKGAIQSLNSNLSDVFFWEKYTTKPLVDNGTLNRIGEFITPWSCFQIIASNSIIEQEPNALKELLNIINFSNKQFMKATNSIDEVSQRFEMLLEDAYSWFYSTEWSSDQNISEKMLENVMYSLEKIGVIQKQVENSDIVHTDFVKLV